MHHNNVRKVTKERGLKQPYVAGLLGIAMRTFTHKMDGKSAFSAEQRAKLVAFFGVAESDLFPEGQS